MKLSLLSFLAMAAPAFQFSLITLGVGEGWCPSLAICVVGKGYELTKIM